MMMIIVMMMTRRMRILMLTKFLNSHPGVTVDWIKPLVHLKTKHVTEPN